MVEEATSKQEVSSSSPIRNWRLIVQVDSLIFCKINAKFNAKIGKIYAKFNANYVRLALIALSLCKINAKFNAKYVRSTLKLSAKYVRSTLKFNAKYVRSMPNFNAKLCKISVECVEFK